MLRTLAIEPEWDSFREAARGLLRDGVLPGHVAWHESAGFQSELPLAAQVGAPPVGRTSGAEAKVPRRFLELGEAAACFRAPAPWPLLYRVLWRVTRGERTLLEDAADADIAELHRMERAVRRDTHKMTEFVRFRSVADPEGERFIAWFEPQHRIVKRVSPFFARRFPSMRWSILTPDRCVHWIDDELLFTDGVHRDAAPDDDALETLWLTYYGHTFNPARVRVRAMCAEMPRHYWRNLPEAGTIATLLREAPRRVDAMIERARSIDGDAVGSEVRTALPRSRASSDVGAARVALLPTRGQEPPDDVRPMRVPKVRVGVAGWDYPDWAGLVYPETRTGVDRLRWVSARFDLIEVNSTFYRPVSPRVAHGWLERTADRAEFRFAAKLLRGFTHEAGPWREADAAAVRAGLLPLLDAGRFDSLLVQFPWSFRNEPEQRRRLKRVLDAFGDFPLHVEVRHASWDVPAFREWLAGREVGIVNIDQPLFDHSIAPAAEVTSRVAYLRLHGRNVANWFRADATRDERYDYSYPDEELLPWVERARSLAARPNVDRVDVVFNNHYRAQAVNNALTFARMLAVLMPAPRRS